MISTKKSWTILSLLAIFALLITACAPEADAGVRIAAGVYKPLKIDLERFFYL
jgi:hypothetical protein